MAVVKKSTKKEAEEKMKSEAFAPTPPGFSTTDELLGDVLSAKGIEAISARQRLGKRELIYDVKDSKAIKEAVAEYEAEKKLEADKKQVLG